MFILDLRFLVPAPIRFFALLVAASIGAAAQVPDLNVDLKHISLEQLADLKVTTTTKEPIAVHNTAAAVTVITSEDIRRAGVTSVADALRLAPGVEVARISSTTWAIAIRGLQSNFSKSVLVLVDGRSVYTPLFAGVYWDVQDLLLQDIERIEVIRGPGGTIWGPNAVNGVINIITKHSRETKGLLLSAGGGGPVDRSIESARFGAGLGQDFSYRVHGKGFTRGPEFHSDGNYFDAWHQERGGFRMDWSRGTDDYLLEGDVYGGNSPHLLGSIVSNDAVSGGNLLARWTHQFENGSDLYLQTYFDRTVRVGFELGETRNTIDVDLLHHFRSGRHEVSWGGGLRWSPNFVSAPLPAVKVLPADITEQNHSLFGQDEIHFSDRVSITLGTKLQYNNFSGWDAQPTARLLVTPDKNQSFWAAVTRAVTTPSRIEEGFLLQGSAAPGVIVVVTGDPNFHSEVLLGFEAGYRRLFGRRFYLDLTAFHNKYSDLQSFSAPAVSMVGGNTVIQVAYANAIAGQTNGIEIAPSWQVRPGWRLTGSYSYVGIDLHANAATSDVSSTGSVRTYEGSTPHHEAEIQSTLRLTKRLEFDQFFRVASALPAQSVRAYSTMDARLGYTVGAFEFSVVGQNLFQPTHYEWGTGDPAQSLVGIRRNVFASITIRK